MLDRRTDTPHPPMTARIEQLLFARRRLVLAVFALITLAMAWLATGLRVDAGFTKLVPVEHEYMQTFLQYREEFGGADRVVIAVMARDGDMFTPGFFEVLRKVTDATFFLPGVDRTQVFSILTPNVRFIEVIEDGVAAGNVMPVDFEPTEAGFARVRENVIKAGIVGRLVANDFTGAIVAAKLQEFHPDTGERLDYIEVAHELERIRREATSEAGVDVHVDLHVIGFAKMVGDIADGAVRVMTFFGITFLITALFVYAYTRSVRLTVPPLVCSLIAVVWQLGGVTALGFGVDPMSILVPFLVFAIGVSHGVQMVSSVRAETAGGASGLDAARASFRRLLLPGAVALASDSVGFVTISLIEVQVIKEIAITASLGVAAIILTNLALLPVLLSYFEADDEERRAARERDDILRPVWSRVARVAHRGPAAAVIGVAAVLLAAGAHLAPQVRVGDEHRGVPELRADSAYNVDSAVITDRFEIGVDVLTVISETVEEGCIDYEVMRTLDDFEWHVRNVDGVQSVHGLAGVARGINAMWNEGSLKWRALPRNHYMLVQSVSPVPTGSGLLNLDCSVMPVSIYTADHKAQTIERVVEAVKEFDAANYQRAHHLPARFRQRRSNGGDQRGGRGVPVPDPRLRLCRGHCAVPALLPLGGGDGVHHRAARGGVPARLRADGAAPDRAQGLHPAGGGARGGDRGGLRDLHLRAAAHPPRAGARLRGRLRADAGHHRSGRRAHRPHAGGGGGDLDRGAAEVPGRHGHGADVHVPRQHGRRGGASARPRRVAGQAGEDGDQRGVRSPGSAGVPCISRWAVPAGSEHPARTDRM